MTASHLRWQETRGLGADAGLALVPDGQCDSHAEHRVDHRVVAAGTRVGGSW